MLTCPRCGTSVEQHAVACPRCGIARDPDATRVRPPVGPAAAPAGERTPTSPTSPATRRPAAPYTPTPPLPRRPRTGLVVGLAAGLVLLLVAGVGATLWWQRGGDAPPAADGGGATDGGDPGGEAVSFVADGSLNTLSRPLDGTPEEAWTWESPSAVVGYVLSPGGVVVGHTEGAPYRDPARATKVGPDGEEMWTVRFTTATQPRSLLDDERLLGVRLLGRPRVEVVAPSTGESLWVADGTYLGAAGSDVLVTRPAGGGLVDLVALDGTSGRERWTVERVSLASASSASGGTAVTLSEDGTVRVHEAGTGEVRWERTSPVDVEVRADTGPLAVPSQAVVLTGEQVVVVGTDGSAGLDAEDGTRRWATDEVVGARGSQVVPLLDSRAVVFPAPEQRGPTTGATVVDTDGPVGPPLPVTDADTSSAAWSAGGLDLTMVRGTVLTDGLEQVGSPYPVVLPVEGGFYGLRPGRVELVDASAPDEPVWGLDVAELLQGSNVVGAIDRVLISAGDDAVTGYR